MGKTRKKRINNIGLAKTDYNGRPTTLCKGCGHNSIASQIIQVAYDLHIEPTEIIKLSGIGCSSKSPAYFLGQSFGFNALHGRMPSIGTGALMMNQHLKAIGVSGDGDTASIGMGQFKHLARRNVRLVYIVENNGVYGLTKGQFSATADEDQRLKYAGWNRLPEIDICLEAIAAGCGFVARSFSGDAKQVRSLLKAALSHNGTAVLDIISPCVAFNNDDSSRKSYGYGKANEIPLHDIGFIPQEEEIQIEEYKPGETRVVELHDGSHIKLVKLEEDYDPTDPMGAMHRVQWARQKEEFITGLIYYNPDRESFADINEMVEAPLSSLPADQIRPSAESLEKIMAGLM